MNKCPNKAEYVYPWAGKIMEACPKHVNAMVMIANAIGSPIEVRELAEKDKPCMHNDDLESND